MDYEKKYKEALKWVREIYPTMTGCDKEDAEHYFPELKESGDEKIRKQLIAVVELYYGETPEQEKKDCLAWLEKQSEEARNIALRTEYEKGRADAIAEMQTPALSEKDEKMLKETLALIETVEDINKAKDGFLDVKMWLKSLKDRVQPLQKGSYEELIKVADKYYDEVLIGQCKMEERTLRRKRSSHL